MAGSKYSLLFLALFIAALTYQAEALPTPADEMTVEIQLPEGDEDSGRWLGGLGKIIAKGVKALASKGATAVKTYVKNNGKTLLLKGAKAVLGAKEEAEE